MIRPTCLGYSVFEVADINAWKGFASQIVGVDVRGDDPVLLRVDEQQARIFLHQGPADDVVAAGWELPNEATLDAYVEQLRANGVEVQAGDVELAANRKVRKIFFCLDPDGWRHEFYFGAATAPSTEPLTHPLVQSGFVAGDLGFGHIVSAASSAKATNAFYRDKLGFLVSDHIKAEGGLAGDGLDLTFYHVGSGRHHSIAVSEIPGFPKKMNHLMFECHSMADVGLAYDRFVDAGVPILSTIGQHPNDKMISFYALTPSGFGIEMGCNCLVVNDDDWKVTTYSQASLWGHKPMEMPAP